MGRVRIGLCAVAVATMAAAVAASGAFATTSPAVYVNIHVTLTDSKVIVTPKTAPRGANARFIVTNKGTKVHSFTFSFGSNKGFRRSFKPKQHQILLLYLDLRGIYNYYGGTSLATSSPAMKGAFVVGPTCSACIQDY
jgi:hypothetical protein